MAGLTSNVDTAAPGVERQPCATRAASDVPSPAAPPLPSSVSLGEPGVSRNGFALGWTTLKDALARSFEVACPCFSRSRRAPPGPGRMPAAAAEREQRAVEGIEHAVSRMERSWSRTWPWHTRGVLAEILKRSEELQQPLLYGVLRRAADSRQPGLLGTFVTAALRAAGRSAALLHGLTEALLQLPPDAALGQMKSLLAALESRPKAATGPARALLAVSLLGRLEPSQQPEMFDRLLRLSERWPGSWPAREPVLLALAAAIPRLSGQSQQACFDRLLEIPASLPRVTSKLYPYQLSQHELVLARHLDIYAPLLATLAAQLRGLEWPHDALQQRAGRIFGLLERIDDEAEVWRRFAGEPAREWPQHTVDQFLSALGLLATEEHQVGAFQILARRIAADPENDARQRTRGMFIDSIRRLHPGPAGHAACVRSVAARFDLQAADLTGIALQGARLLWNGRCLTGAHLDEAGIAQLLQELLEEDPGRWIMGSTVQLDGRDHFVGGGPLRDVAFNHLDHGASVLTAIDSIPPRHDCAKVQMMEALVAKLEQALELAQQQNVDISDITPSLMDVLGRNPLYLRASPRIREFAVRRLLEPEMARCDMTLIPARPAASQADRAGSRPVTDGWLKMMMDHIAEGLRRAEWPWAQRHGMGIFQVLSLAAACPGALAKQAQEIREAYRAAVPEEEVRQLVQVVNTKWNTGEDFLPVFSHTGESVLLLSDDYFERCARRQEGPGRAPSPWGGLAVLKRGAPGQAARWVLHNLGHTSRQEAESLILAVELQGVPLLGQLYAAQHSEPLLRRVLGAMLPPRFVEEALAARDKERSARKWVSTGKQEALRAHVAPLLDDTGQKRAGKPLNVRLTAQPRGELMALCRTLLPGGDEREAGRAAYFCRCCAALLTGLSSSRHTGEEEDSPYALRLLAAALLNEAQRLAPLSAPKHADFLRKLLGIGSVLTCTGELFEDMRFQLLEALEPGSALQAAYNLLIPAAW